MEYVKIRPAGDRALVAEFENRIDESVNDRVHALAEFLKGQNLEGIVEVQPTFRSLMIYYDPLRISFREIQEAARRAGSAADPAAKKKRRILQIPCCYGARFGQDLADLERHTGLDRDEIIAIHSSVDYKIYMMGFLPGFVYLGGMDERICMPRLENPRVKIQPGAVGIGGNQTGVYPVASPGGWRLIGGTPVDFYDPFRADPILCRAGEYIRFLPITIDEYYDIRRLVSEGKYEVKIREEGE